MRGFVAGLVWLFGHIFRFVDDVKPLIPEFKILNDVYQFSVFLAFKATLGALRCCLDLGNLVLEGVELLEQFQTALAHELDLQLLPVSAQLGSHHVSLSLQLLLVMNGVLHDFQLLLDLLDVFCLVNGIK